MDNLGFEALSLALFEPQIFHLQMGLQVWEQIGWHFASLTSLER